jgi:hypothetical protein
MQQPVIQRVPIKTIRIARRLRQLGCAQDQIRWHLDRGKGPPTIVLPRPRPMNWQSWENRIRGASRL